MDIHPFLLSRKNCCLRSNLEIVFLLINKLYLFHRITAIVYSLPFLGIHRKLSPEPPFIVVVPRREVELTLAHVRFYWH